MARRFVSSGIGTAGAASPAEPSAASPALVAPAADASREPAATAASPAGSTPTSVPERIVRPRSKDTVATGVAAATPGIARYVGPAAHDGSVG